MYRVLVADDEGIMLKSMEMILSAEFSGQCELAFAKTGRAVIEQAESFRPDIIFMDIQMPGLNGIQAMKEIRKNNEKVIFIVISAYDRFSYAQDAINLGAMEYLTKPVNKKKIVETTSRAMEIVDGARKKRSDDLRIREKLETVIPMIEGGFIYNILLQDEPMSYGGNYKELLNITQDYGFLILIEFGDSIEEGILTNTIGASVKANGFYQDFREIAKEFFECIVGPVMGNRIILFVPHERAEVSYEERVFYITQARNMVHKLEKRTECTFRAGIGSVSAIDDLQGSYKEAVTALKEEGHVVHIKDVSPESGYDGEYPEEVEKRYLRMVENSNLTGAVAEANEFFDWMENNYYDYREDIELKVLELIIKLEQKAFQRGKIKYGFRYRENYLHEVHSCSDYKALRSWFLSKTKEICSNFAAVKERESGGVTEKAQKYIQSHFQKDISLDDVSRQVDISPYYFSKLFRQETGKTFIEYLTDTRINYAKELLLHPELSIKEVCRQSGYSDPNYFSRIFKKYEKVSPSEYREREGL